MNIHKQNIPRGEYPRPQLVRRDWLCLNGEWLFAFDDDCSGHTDGWDCEIPECAVPIIVPYVYQSTLSGIDVSDYHEMVWYWKEIDVPPSWDGCYVALNFGAVDYHCKIFINKHFRTNRTWLFSCLAQAISLLLALFLLNCRVLRVVSSSALIWLLKPTKPQ